MTLDLSLAVFEKDVYINFESICANVSIVLPDGVNVTCDIDKKLAKVGNMLRILMKMEYILYTLLVRLI